MTIRQRLRGAFYTLAPAFVIRAYLAVRLRRRAGDLMRRAIGLEHPAERCGLLWQFPEFLPLQKVSEITRFLLEVGRDPPAVVVEIGSAAGGTAFLFARTARPDATLVLVDWTFDAGRRAALEAFAGDGQRIVCLSGDSHSEAMAQAILQAIRGRPVDLLFIDGDHSYAGVVADFRRYGPMVRRGGIVAFHDIVPDAAMRRRAKPESGADAGAVPAFWAEIRERYNGEEIIENPDQDGCGIGMIRWQG